jgi:hypothetical protein
MLLEVKASPHLKVAFSDRKMAEEQEKKKQRPAEQGGILVRAQLQGTKV